MNSPFTFGGASARGADSPTTPRSRCLVGAMVIAVTLRRRAAHRVEDLPVTRAAADVSGQRLADLRLGRLGVVAKQRGGGDDETWRAEPALHRARLDEGALH